jgi:hypothetical protein
MFRQDDRINKIFLPFLPVPLLAGKKGKKHYLSSRGGVHSLCRQNSHAMGKASIVDFSPLFSAEAKLRFHGFIPVFSGTGGSCGKQFDNTIP